MINAKKLFTRPLITLCIITAPSAAMAQSSAQTQPSDNQKAAELKQIVDKLTADMVLVEGGTFTMGADKAVDSYANDDELPAHKVTLSAFHISKYEVTQRLWQAVMGSNPSYFRGDDRPVEWVSWDNCQQFIKRLNALTGKHFRLPTEAEWEFAARGGNKSHGYRYSGSDDISQVAWHKANSEWHTHNVGTRKPNELGLYDMTGNVSEWCQDWYDEYPSAAQTDPQGPGNTNRKVYRGGCWNDDEVANRITARDKWYAGPSGKSAAVGFRLAM